jgi:hypothetical protein
MFRCGRRRTRVSKVRRTVNGSCAVFRVRRRRRRTAVLAATIRFQVGRRMSWRGLLRSSGRWRSAGIGTLPAGRHGIAVVRVGGGGAERRTRSRNRRPARTTPGRRNGDDSVERVKLIRDLIGVRRRARVLRPELLFAAQPPRSERIVEQHGRVHLDGWTVPDLYAPGGDSLQTAGRRPGRPQRCGAHAGRRRRRRSVHARVAAHSSRTTWRAEAVRTTVPRSNRLRRADHVSLRSAMQTRAERAARR